VKLQDYSHLRTSDITLPGYHLQQHPVYVLFETKDPEVAFVGLQDLFTELVLLLRFAA